MKRLFPLTLLFVALFAMPAEAKTKKQPKEMTGKCLIKD